MPKYFSSTISFCNKIYFHVQNWKNHFRGKTFYNSWRWHVKQWKSLSSVYFFFLYDKVRLFRYIHSPIFHILAFSEDHDVLITTGHIKHCLETSTTRAILAQKLKKIKAKILPSFQVICTIKGVFPFVQLWYVIRICHITVLGLNLALNIVDGIMDWGVYPVQEVTLYPQNRN